MLYESVQLEKVIKAIKEATKNNELLNIKILSKKLGMSRVTVSKYVHYLIGAGKIEVQNFGKNKIIRWKNGK